MPNINRAYPNYALLWLGGGLVLLEDLAATVDGEVEAW